MKAVQVRATFMIVMVLLASSAVRGDEWPAPGVRNVFSDDGRFFVRVVPGTGTGGRGCPGGPEVQSARKARGEFYAQGRDRTFRLVADVERRNPVSPVYAVVTNTGHLVTFDNWFCMGHGDVIVVYGPRGRAIRNLRLDDLYDPARLIEIPFSASSRLWRCAVYPSPPADNERIAVFEHSGGAFIVDARTGAFEYRPGTSTCAPGSRQSL